MGKCADCGLAMTTVDVEACKGKLWYMCVQCWKAKGARANGKEPAELFTKRERFAAMAMQGYLANPELHSNPNGGVANASVQAADALLLALEETKP